MRKLFGTDGVRGTANTHPITAEMALRIAGASLYGTQVAIRAAHNASGNADVDTETIAQQARQFVHRMRPQQRHDVATTYLYLYRNLSLTELRDYVGRFESEPVRALQRSLIQALGAEMIAVQSDVIHELVADRKAPMAADI